MRYLKKIPILLLAAVVMLLGAAWAAGAQEITPDAPSVAPEAALTLSEWTVYAIVTLAIPIAVGLLTRSNASARAKHIATLFFSTVTALIVTHTQVDGTAVISLTTLKYTGGTFLVATFTYLGVYKPYDLNAKLLPNRGFGGSATG